MLLVLIGYYLYRQWLNDRADNTYRLHGEGRLSGELAGVKQVFEGLAFPLLKQRTEVLKKSSPMLLPSTFILPTLLCSSTILVQEIRVQEIRIQGSRAYRYPFGIFIS